MNRFRTSLICLALFCGPALAQPVPYALQPEDSIVGFETDFGPDVITGRFPIKSADLRIDFGVPTRSQVDVVLDISNATASFPFAAQALRGPRVLDARSFPEMVFESTAVRLISDGVADVDGNLTIRDVTRPVTLRAETYRQRGSAAGDFRRLTMILTGAVNRSDYGATGWADMVSDEVRLRITARIIRID